MPIPSPFHDRLVALNESYAWKDWAGYYAPCRFEYCHGPEYFAFRHAAGMIDVTPLYKYELIGKDAAALLARMTVRDMRKLKVGRVVYTCWCDDEGKVVDDGTVTRLGKEHFRLTAAEPTLHWIERLARGLSVEIEDSTGRIAAVALQGPTSRDILASCSDVAMDKLKFFRAKAGLLDDLEVVISRTGYTGDLGYEVWVDADKALKLWDALMSAGNAYGIRPVGLDALDVARIEAGFIMLGVDYYTSPKEVLASRKSTPHELGLGWTVQLDRDPFVGQAAIRAELERGPAWSMVGLEVSWKGLEELYESYGMPPSLPAAACREALPVFAGGKQIGRATSHTWSPTLKKQIALASLKTEHAKVGTRLAIEHTVDWSRHTVPATVVETPFFNPQRKRA